MRANGALTGVLLGLTVLTIASCGGKEAEVRGEFMAGCEGPGAQQEICECAFDKLKEHYGVETLIAMHEEGFAPPDFAQTLVSAGLQCRGGDVYESLGSLGVGGIDEQSGASDVLGEPVVWRDGTPYPASKVEAWHGGTPPNLSQLEGAVDTAIQVKAREDGGAEYRDARQAVTGDLNGDSQSDIAAIFTIEIAAYNSYTQYLAVATGQPDGAVQWADTIAVGGRGHEATGLTIEAGAIKLASLTQGPDDPDCCPTMEVTTDYMLHNGKLRQLM